MTNQHYIRIIPDFDNLYDDSNGCSCPPFGDEISNDDPALGPVFRIVVPGIHEWVRRYENATDFADTVTDPSFDWKSWHFEGLQFAKAICEQLPRCYTLFYMPPYEDKSGTIGEFKVDENIDSLIERLGPKSLFNGDKPALSENIDFSATRAEESVVVHFKLGGSKYDVTIPFSHMQNLKKWLEGLISCIWFKDEPIHQLSLPGYHLTFFQQTIGVHSGMGRFWISDRCGDLPRFSAYVNARLFIKGLYLALMNALGFYHYPISLADDEEYPAGEERRKIWEPYNTLKSVKIEQNISDVSTCQHCEANAEPIDQSIVMYCDYDIFFDSMGVCIGDYDTIHTDDGEVTLNIPGLKKWASDYETRDSHSRFEYLWQKGWELALEVRNQLPDNIDLYYMCYNPSRPNELVDYTSNLLKIIVPRICDLH